MNRRAGLPKLPNQLPALTFPEIQRATLGNGVELILAERHALPLVEVTMQFDAGYAADSGGKLGVFFLRNRNVGFRHGEAQCS